MRGSKERCLARRRDRGGKRRGENRRTEEQGEMQKKAGTERGRRKEKEGVVGTVTEKDCGTDGDMESQQGRGQEGLGGGAEGWTVGARLRGSRLGAEAGRGRGRSGYRGDFSHPRWPWLPQGLRKKRGAVERGSCLPEAGQLQNPRTYFSVREGAAQWDEKGEGRMGTEM